MEPNSCFQVLCIWYLIKKNKNLIKQKKYTKGNFSVNKVQRFLDSNIVSDIRQSEYSKESPPKTFMQKNWAPLMLQANAAHLHFVTKGH